MSDATGDHFGRIPAGMKWCPYCNGYGSSLKEASGRCTHCGGSGLVWADRDRPVAGRNGEHSAPRSRTAASAGPPAPGRPGEIARRRRAADADTTAA